MADEGGFLTKFIPAILLLLHTISLASQYLITADISTQKKF